VVWWIKDVHRTKGKQIKTEIIMMGRDILSMLHIPVALFIIIMICLPIGTGAAANLWSSIAADWKTDANTVALVTGVLSGLISAVGCVAGGYLADRWGNWVAYLGSGCFCALVTLTMSVLPYEPRIYVMGVLAYGFGLGLMNAAFTSALLLAIGNKNATTKYSLLASLGNLPVVYMTTFDGWAHDKHNSKFMLVAEAALGMLFILICVVTLRQLKARKMLPNPGLA
jgi:MFS transporter, PAT family, beta-lactamase induction signal transducer AmpG